MIKNILHGAILYSFNADLYSLLEKKTELEGIEMKYWLEKD